MDLPAPPPTRLFSRYAPGGKAGVVMTISKALDLDRNGRNDEAVEAIRSHQHNMLSSGPLDEIVEGSCAEARIQRHHGEADVLVRACDSAQQAVLLGRLPAASRELAAPVCLELAACRIRRGDPADIQAIAGFMTCLLCTPPSPRDRLRRSS